MKRCLICGRTYESHAPNSKYCSLECGYKARVMKRNLWNEKHSGYMASYMREYRARKKAANETHLPRT